MSVAADDPYEAALNVATSARRRAAAGQGRAARGRGRGRLGATLRRLVVAIVGFAFLLAGVAMLVLPGPGLVAIVAGLAVLATEFSWAERRLHQSRQRALRATELMTASRSGTALLVISAVSMIVAGTVLVAMALSGALGSLAMAGATLLLSGAGAMALAIPSVRRRLGVEATPDPT